MKVTGAVKNLVQGVSTQNPKERLEGQVWTMNNFLPDPVEGAVKRPGVKHTKSLLRSLPGELGKELLWRNLNIETGEYALGTYDGRIILRNLSTGEDVQVIQDTSTYPYFQEGVQATANIGEYTLLAGTAIAQATTQELVSLFPQSYRDNGLATTVGVNRVVVVEVRQGAYAGVYSIKRNDGSVLATYTVPDGSVASHSTNAQPVFIASQLYTTLVGLIGGTVGSGTIRAVQQVGANIAIFFNYTVLDEPVAMFADDGVYNTRMIMTDRFSTDSNRLPAVGVEGHVVEIGSNTNREGNYYLRFEHTQKSVAGLTLNSNTLRPGRWVETSQSYASTGYANGGVLNEETLPSLLYFYEGVAYVGSGTYIAATVQSETGIVIDKPLSWSSRTSGDEGSNQDPLFVGSPIRWMGIFQDRLVIISDDAVDMSATGDYLRFYRQSVIADLATDPIHLVSTFDPTDFLVGAALLDKNLMVVGTKSHYTISGRTALTPTSAALLKTSSFESSPQVAPVSFGNLVYFSSASTNNSDVLAIQPSDVTDSTYAYSVSSHVDGFIPGDLSSLQASTKIDMLFTLSDAGELFPYRTLFNQGERMLSSWFKFTFPTSLKLRCIALTNTKVKMLFDRIEGENYYTVVGELNLDRVGYTGAAGHRYLDFWQDVEGDSIDPVYAAAVLGGVDGQVIDRDTNLLYKLLDGEDDVPLEAEGNYMVGVPYTCVFEPTMPLARDREGRVIGIGTLVVSQMQVTYTLASGFTIKIKDKFNQYEFEYAVRQVDAPDSFTDSDYIRDGSYRFPVGSMDAGCRVSLTSYDHFPLILSSLDWAGQYFKRGTTM